LFFELGGLPPVTIGQIALIDLVQGGSAASNGRANGQNGFLFKLQKAADGNGRENTAKELFKRMIPWVIERMAKGCH